MRIVVDVDRCSGHALCAARSPELFVLDELGYNRTPVIQVPTGQEETARAAVAGCPEQAMVIEDE
jgi:ferredoxin